MNIYIWCVCVLYIYLYVFPWYALNFLVFVFNITKRGLKVYRRCFFSWYLQHTAYAFHRITIYEAALCWYVFVFLLNIFIILIAISILWNIFYNWFLSLMLCSFLLFQNEMVVFFFFLDFLIEMHLPFRESFIFNIFIKLAFFLFA